METITLKLTGMGCTACSDAIQETITKLPGIIDCQVDFVQAQAKVGFQPEQINIDQIKQAVVEAG
ncbi:MAG: heavy-metal-associated domain-containing protein, partial [Microcoleaceae cyanobacterium]